MLKILAWVEDGLVRRWVAAAATQQHRAPHVQRPADLLSCHLRIPPAAARYAAPARQVLPPGVASGLAWTENGGEILYIEANLLPNSRILRLIGHLGKVMRESARIAHSFVWSHAAELGIDPSRFHNTGVHIHVPAGAILKDGPSAGVALVTALASLYSGKPVRSDTAMTGEIMLTGLVMPVGGVKDKVLAARRAGLHRVLLPKDNLKDLRLLPEAVRSELTILPVESAKDILAAALGD